MWYGLATQAAKDEAEAFGNQQKTKRIALTIEAHTFIASANKAEQKIKDEATWQEMRKSFGRYS